MKVREIVGATSIGFLGLGGAALIGFTALSGAGLRYGPAMSESGAALIIAGLCGIVWLFVTAEDSGNHFRRSKMGPFILASLSVLGLIVAGAWFFSMRRAATLSHAPTGQLSEAELKASRIGVDHSTTHELGNVPLNAVGIGRRASINIALKEPQGKGRHVNVIFVNSGKEDIYISRVSLINIYYRDTDNDPISPAGDKMLFVFKNSGALVFNEERGGAAVYQVRDSGVYYAVDFPRKVEVDNLENPNLIKVGKKSTAVMDFDFYVDNAIKADKINVNVMALKFDFIAEDGTIVSRVCPFVTIARYISTNWEADGGIGTAPMANFPLDILPVKNDSILCDFIIRK